jgi:DNA-binding MarR family transcriptional regulator
MAIRYECTTMQYAVRRGITQTYAKRALDKMVQQGLAIKVTGTRRGERTLYHVLELGDWFHDPFNLCLHKERF